MVKNTLTLTPKELVSSLKDHFPHGLRRSITRVFSLFDIPSRLAAFKTSCTALSTAFSSLSRSIRASLSSGSMSG